MFVYWQSYFYYEITSKESKYFSQSTKKLSFEMSLISLVALFVFFSLFFSFYFFISSIFEDCM